MDESRHDASSQGNPGRGHETRDMSIRPIALFGAGLAVVTGLVLVSMAGLFWYFTSLQQRLEVPPSPMAEMRQPPPEPRLQVSPWDDLRAMRAEEDAVLNNYAWVNRQTGIVRIPIDRAIQLLAERGLPARDKSPDAE